MDESLNRKWTYSQTHTHTRRCSTSQRIILPCIIHEMHIIASIMIAVTHTQPHTHTHAHAHSSTPQWLCIQNVFACDGRRNPRIYLFMCVCVGGWLGICGYPVALLIVELDGRYELNFISVIHTFPMPFLLHNQMELTFWMRNIGFSFTHRILLSHTISFK